MTTQNTKTIFNLEALVSIEIRDKKLCAYLDYRPFKKSFWGNTREGFYDNIENAHYSKEEIEKGNFCGVKLLVEGNNVFYFPCVNTYFADGSKYNKEFDTFEQANQYGRDLQNRSFKISFER